MGPAFHDEGAVHEKGLPEAEIKKIRSQVACIMISNPKDEFCAACRRAISRMIDYYSEAD